MAAGESERAALPPWLPSCSTGFGAFASEVLSVNSTYVSEQQLSQLGGRATELLSKPLDAWDLNLRQELTAVLENAGATPLSPRAKGWLLKQGLLAG